MTSNFAVLSQSIIISVGDGDRRQMREREGGERGETGGGLLLYNLIGAEVIVCRHTDVE